MRLRPTAMLRAAAPILPAARIAVVPLLAAPIMAAARIAVVPLLAAPIMAAARIAVVPLVAAPIMAVAVLAAPAGATTWARPVAGAVTRPFAMHGSPFAAGQHRGVDLAVSQGAIVGAPCGGRVVVAARIGSSRGVVTVACGPWRASVLPLASIGVRRGETVAAGEPVGAAGETDEHAGLHVGVRRASRRFGYVDPLRFLPRPHGPPLGPAPPADEPRRSPREPAAPPRASSPFPVATSVGEPIAAAHRGPVPVAPWPAWAGAAVLLAATAGGVVRRRSRARTAAADRSAAVRVPAGEGAR